MKRFAAILAVTVLLLTGCSAQKEDTPAPSATAEQTQPLNVGEAVVPEEGDIMIEIG